MLTPAQAFNGVEINNQEVTTQYGNAYFTLFKDGLKMIRYDTRVLPIASTLIVPISDFPNGFAPNNNGYYTCGIDRHGFPRAYYLASTGFGAYAARSEETMAGGSVIMYYY